MNVLEQILALAAPTELPAELRLRQLEPSDGERVRAVVDAWWGRPMAVLLPRPLFAEFRDTSFVVERDGELVAFLIGFLSQTEADEAYVHAVAVAPKFRGQGVARLLYQRFANAAARQGRWRLRAITAPSNTASLAFHRRLGFNFRLPSGAGGYDRVDLVLDLPRPTT